MRASKRPRQGTREAPRAATLARRAPAGLSATADSLADVGADAIAALVPGLWAVPVGWKMGSMVRAILGGEPTSNRAELLRARVTGLALTVAEVRRIAVAAHGVTPEEFLERLTHPDSAFILSAARDHYALAQLRPRLRRFAAVLAGRIPQARADDPIDDDLRFARAALDVPEEGVLLVAQMVAKGQADAARRANNNPKQFRVLFGQTRMADFLERRPYADQADVDATVAAAHAAQTHSLIMLGDDRPPRMVGTPQPIAEIRCTDGTSAYFPNDTWWPTSWAFAFVEAIESAQVVSTQEPAPDCDPKNSTSVDPAAGQGTEPGPDPVPAGS